MSTYQQTLANHANGAKRLLRPLVSFVLCLWLLENVDWLVFDGSLDRLGIVPRRLVGLRGIFFAPFLHGNFSHLVANTVPFLVLGFLVLTRHARRFLVITLMIVVISGLGTWLIAPASTVHIGLSGVIFGYLAFLVVNAWYERSPAAVLLAVLVLVLYGGLVTGIVPTGNGVSWQGHLFGLVGGAAAAFYYSPRR